MSDFGFGTNPDDESAEQNGKRVNDGTGDKRFAMEEKEILIDEQKKRLELLVMDLTDAKKRIKEKDDFIKGSILGDDMDKFSQISSQSQQREPEKGRGIFSAIGGFFIDSN